MKKYIFILMLIGSVIAIGYFLNIEKKQPVNKKETESYRRIKRIILISVDILRADHLSYYRYPINTSPFIDELSKNSVNFKNAFANISLSVPSDATIFTSLFPLQHRVFSDYMMLDDTFVTMAELLRENGFKTAAFVGSEHYKYSNILQGFDKIDIPAGARSADKTIDIALDWMKNTDKGDNVFLWIHFYDLNKQFNALPLYRDLINSNLEKIGKDSFLNSLVKSGKNSLSCTMGDPQNKNSYFQYTLQELADLIIKYDAKVKFLDDEIKGFYQSLEGMGLLNDETLLIFTSEHGDGLCSHSYFSHGFFIYNEQLHVPLLFHFPGHNYSTSIENIVEHIDILPTIAELTNISLRQIKPIQGISLTQLLNNDNVNDFPDKYVFSQKRYHYRKELGINNDKGMSAYSLQNKYYKYIYNKNGEDEFYDLSNDPNELRNLVGKDWDIKNKFKEEIINKINQFKEDDNDGNLHFTHSEDATKYLESVGYFR